MVKVKDKERILKEARKITATHYIQEKLKSLSDFPAGTSQARMEQKDVFKAMKEIKRPKKSLSNKVIIQNGRKA